VSTREVASSGRGQIFLEAFKQQISFNRYSEALFVCSNFAGQILGKMMVVHVQSRVCYVYEQYVEKPFPPLLTLGDFY
jgi:hypothetical protein